MEQMNKLVGKSLKPIISISLPMSKFHCPIQRSMLHELQVRREENFRHFSFLVGFIV